MIVVVGLSHKTAPIEVRERAALSDARLADFLQRLLQTPTAGEAFVVSTCNRMEIIAAPRNGVELDSLMQDVTSFLTSEVPGIGAHLYQRSGIDALQHLFRVASSLDSLVLGEPQILGQVKEALELGRKSGAVGGQLNRIVAQAVRAAKRVRSETAIGAGQVSVPSVAVDLARQIFGQLERRCVVLVGSGAMGEAAAKALTSSGARLFVVGRNRERTEALCASLGGTARPFDELPQALWEADVVISATSATEFVIDVDMVKAVHKKRRGRSLFLIDLAVPRDIDPKISTLDSVFLYNVDDLSEIVAQSLSSRQKEAERAEVIIALETASFERARSAEQVTPTILALRTQFDVLLKAEIEKSLRTRLKHLGSEDREAISRMVDAGVNKILHPATRVLRQLAADPASRLELDAHLAVLRDLFDLDQTGTSGAAATTLQDTFPAVEEHIGEHPAAAGPAAAGPAAAGPAAAGPPLPSIGQDQAAPSEPSVTASSGVVGHSDLEKAF